MTAEKMNKEEWLKKNNLICQKKLKPQDLLKKLTDENNITWENSFENSETHISKSAKLTNVKIMIDGHDNRIIIDDNAVLDDCSVYIEGNCNTVKIGAETNFKGAYFLCINDNNEITIGDETTINGEFWGKTVLHTADASKISIGKDCMLSGSVTVRTTDGHAILNENVQRINNPKDISIANHVWIGMNVTILKGSVLPKNSIVGANSVVTKQFEDITGNTLIIGGNPAKVLKSEKIYWVRKRGFSFTAEDFKL